MKFVGFLLLVLLLVGAFISGVEVGQDSEIKAASSLVKNLSDSLRLYKRSAVHYKQLCDKTQYVDYHDWREKEGCINPRDYQIELHMDTVWIYDGERLVGDFITTHQSVYDSIFIKDNE